MLLDKFRFDQMWSSSLICFNLDFCYINLDTALGSCAEKCDTETCCNIIGTISKIFGNRYIQFKT